MTEIQSVPDLLKVIEQLDFWSKDHAHKRFWFRGHSQTGWQLQPGVYRPAFQPITDTEELRLRKERHLTQDFRAFSASLRTGKEKDADIYFLQQHYRMPTRLLDWTTNPLAALHFVVREDDEQDGELIWMDAYQLALKQSVPEKVFRGIATSRHKLFEQAVNVISNWHAEENFPTFIMPVRPDHFDQRISRQQGYFTFHVPNVQLTHDTAKLERFLVPHDAKQSLKQELFLLGMNDFAAFGDLDRLSGWLKVAYSCG